MIDERRIVEAKKAFIADKKILGIIAMNDLACGFKEGANWAINEFLKDLWHPASEEPIESAEVLAEAKITESINTYLSFKRNDALFKNWAAYSFGANITRWLYIDDLFQKEGGNHD